MQGLIRLNILSQLLVRNAKQNWYYYINRFHLSGTVWLMNVHMKMSQKTNLAHVKTKPTVLVDCKTYFDSTHSQ